MLKRAASHLKGMATGFVNNAINGVTGGFKSGFVNSVSGNQAKVAAQLLKKSPFEVPDSPIAKATADPLQFSHVSYPRDLESNGLGHYILFYTMANNFDDVIGDLKTQKQIGVQVNPGDIESGVRDKLFKNIRGLAKGSGQSKPFTPIKTNNSVLPKRVASKTATSAISIYMPPGVKVNYSMSYDVESTDTAGTIARAISNTGKAGDTAGAVNAAIKGLAGSLGSYGKKLIDEVGESLELGRPAQLISKAVGVAFNPHEEQFFKKPNFRSFSYTFDFWPKNEAEMEDVNKIIFLFKYHMHPTLDEKTGGRLFKVPSEFEIHYAYFGRENEYLNKISVCVLKDMSVEYGPSEQFSTFRPSNKGAAPVNTKLTLEFEETQFITKTEIAEGY
jgi:hypothetical protein